MKQSDKLRLRTRKLIAKNLIILVALAVVAFVGAYSWFTDHTQADAQGINIEATAPDGLEFFIVAPSNKTVQQGYIDVNTWIANYNTNHGSETGFVAKQWHEGSLTIDSSDAEFGFLQNLFICETTSDGYTFKIPKLEQYGEIAYVDTSQTFDDATANQEYLSFDIYFRCKTPGHDVKMLYTSSLAPTGTPATTSPETMKHAAIGAVRMSVYNGSTRELLWIPGPHVWFDGTTNNGEGTLHVNQTTYPTGRGNVYVSGNSYALYSERTIDHAYYNASGSRTIEQNTPLNNNTNNIVASTGTGSDEYKLGTSSANNIAVCTLGNVDSGNGYYYNRIRVNLWIEGEDAESRLKFVGGMFNLQMNYDMDD